MLKNWKVTAYLNSPLIESGLSLEAMMQWEMACRIGTKHSKKMKRDTPIEEIEDVPIPIAKKTVDGIDIFSCSTPIISEIKNECVDRIARRFDTSEVALMLEERERKSILVAAGQYKMKYAPARVTTVDSVSWFVRGDRVEMNKILKKIYAIGKHRNIGYGVVSSWVYTEMEDDFSVVAQRENKKVIMRTLPIRYCVSNGITGYRKGYGSVITPYWHPSNYMEIAIPC
jgi:CRISPR type IV-associated protein Csf3